MLILVSKDTKEPSHILANQYTRESENSCRTHRTQLQAHGHMQNLKDTHKGTGVNTRMDINSKNFAHTASCPLGLFPQILSAGYPYEKYDSLLFFKYMEHQTDLWWQSICLVSHCTLRS